MTTGKICPKCHYSRKPADDSSTPDYACPRCGVIYDKFVSPESASANTHKTGNTVSPKTVPGGNRSGTFSISGRHLVSVVALLIAFFVVYAVFIKPSASKTDLSGTYTGNFINDTISVSVELNIDEQQRITRILKQQTKELRSDGTYEIEETFLWQYPDIAKITYSKLDVNDHGNHYTYAFEKKGKIFSISMDDPQGGFRVNSSFDVHDSDNHPPNINIRNLSTHENIFYLQFDYNIFKAREVQINREDVDMPTRLDIEDIYRYCKPAQRDIGRILEEAATHFRYNRHIPLPFSYSLSPDFNQCSFCMGNRFRPELAFNIFQGKISTDLQRFYDREIKLEDFKFDTDTNVSSYRLEIPEQRLFSRISINSNGYGQFGHPCYPGKLSISVIKSGLALSEEALHNSAQEWKTVFIKRDPRYKKGTFKTIKKREQKAAGQAMEKMKVAGPENDDGE